MITLDERFLDRLTTDEGAALITALEAGKGTKEYLRFLCRMAADALKVAKSQHEASRTDDYRYLPIHRTEAGYPNCATCDGGGCYDCTDPA